MPICPSCSQQVSDSRMTYSDSGPMLCEPCAWKSNRPGRKRGLNARQKGDRVITFVTGTLLLALAVGIGLQFSNSEFSDSGWGRGGRRLVSLIWLITGATGAFGLAFMLRGISRR